MILLNEYDMDYIAPIDEYYRDRILYIDEASNMRANKLKFEICDVDKFVKVNKCKEVSNPVTFANSYEPTSDGLLSNEIFGTTSESRAGIFAYVDLGAYFIDPSCYKTLCKLDSKYKSLIHENEKFIINKQGFLEKSEEGGTGIEYLRKNIDKINFKSTDSIRRDLKIDYINMNKHRMFINKYLIIPAYYRDVNTASGNKNSSGIGVINKMYVNLIRFTKSLKSTMDYGFDNTASIKARIQEELLTIYDWFAGNNNPNISPSEAGTGMSGKMGLIRRVNRSKTVDYASRLVISAGNLKVERTEDIMATMEYSAVPLASVMANFYPYMIFHIKKFFLNEFGTGTKVSKNGNIIRIDNPMKQFDEDRIKSELDNYLASYNNRFKKVTFKDEDGNEHSMKFKSTPRPQNNNNTLVSSTITRTLTWTDVFFIAANEAVENAHILITRYPIDTYWNEFTTKIRVSSTLETEPAIVMGKYYKWYPKIRESDIGTNTSNKFVDTMVLSNLFLDSIGGDYDGDQVIVRGVYTEEANMELEEHMYSKKNIVGIGAELTRISTKDAIQSLFCFTRVLPDMKNKLTNPVF